MRARELVEQSRGGEVISGVCVGAGVVKGALPVALQLRIERLKLGAPCQQHGKNSEYDSFRHPSSAFGAASRRRCVPDASVGSVTTNVVPSPTLLSTVMWPPWASTTSFAIARPKPVPFVAACA